MPSNILQLLQQSERLTSSQVQQLYHQIKTAKSSAPTEFDIIEALIQAKYLTATELCQHLSNKLHLPIVDLSHYDYPTLCQQLGLRDLITRYRAIPLQINDKRQLVLATADPTHEQLEETFRFATNKPIQLVLTDYYQLQTAIRRLYGQISQQSDLIGKEISQEELISMVDLSHDELEHQDDFSKDDAPVSRFIHQIFLDAIRKKASDIHFEPYENYYRIRLRCDGILIKSQQPAIQLGKRLASRLKILAKLDIAEKRLPQDGRIKLNLSNGISIDMRVSTLPTLWGEKIVLRLLNSNKKHLNIDKLGFTPPQQQLYLNALHKPQGMILVTGPTGSGKTVSLYAGITQLNSDEVNISTAEDPIEINLSGINQTQINHKINFDFSQALRTFLRQDPDIVMVGEIRDVETAEIAIKAAQTGHLVLSTLHTNSAAETLIRLNSMGIEAFKLASALTLIIAQRLVRMLCPHCKLYDSANHYLKWSSNNVPRHYYSLQHHQSQPHYPLKIGLKLNHNIPFYKANKSGCHHCNNGYLGRIGIYELMPFSSTIADALIQGAGVTEIELIAINEGMITLKQAGIEKMKQGITSYAELQRVIDF